ncbi:MAG: carboxypeptidase regulatory-like domain-containing protein [Acidobacteria bacterium]|nr:carboxypeptidase regulatory-like domain-containing protein [Acidobacteriota bacterium]
MLNTGAPQPVGGTIAGIVTTSDPAIAVPGRMITVVNVDSGSRYETTTATNGGYTIKVPVGTYRIEIELRPAETLVKRPESTRINKGDLDSGRDFLISVTTVRDPAA